MTSPSSINHKSLGCGHPPNQHLICPKEPSLQSLAFLVYRTHQPWLCRDASMIVHAQERRRINARFNALSTLQLMKNQEKMCCTSLCPAVHQSDACEPRSENKNLHNETALQHVAKAVCNECADTVPSIGLKRASTCQPWYVRLLLAVPCRTESRQYSCLRVKLRALGPQQSLTPPRNEYTGLCLGSHQNRSQELAFS